jgi:hypothetical protein
MATLSVETIVDSGLAATYNAAAAGGDTFVNDGSERQFIHVKNANGAATRTVTVAPSTATTTKPGFGTVTRGNISVIVPISGERFIGPFPELAFGDPDIQYSSEADVTVAVLII